DVFEEALSSRHSEQPSCRAYPRRSADLAFSIGLAARCSGYNPLSIAKGTPVKKLCVGLIVLASFCSPGTAHAASGGTNRPWDMQASATITVVPPQFAGSFHGTHTGLGTIDGTFVVVGFPPPGGVVSA